MRADNKVQELIEQWILCTVTVREELVPGVRMPPLLLQVEHVRTEHFTDASTVTRLENPANIANLHCTVRTTTFTFCYPKGEPSATFTQRLAEVLERHLQATGQLADDSPDKDDILAALGDLLAQYKAAGCRSWWLPLGLRRHDPARLCHFVTADRQGLSVHHADKFTSLQHVDGNVHASDGNQRTFLLTPSPVNGCLAIGLQVSPLSVRSVAYDMLAYADELPAVRAYLEQATKRASYSRTYAELTSRPKGLDNMPLDELTGRELSLAVARARATGSAKVAA